MNKRIVYKHSQENDEFTYDEEGAVVELDSGQYESLKENLENPQKNYILKNSTGVEYQVKDIKEVSRLLSEKNITEVIVEEVSVDNAKLSRFKMNNSHFEKMQKLNPSNEPSFKIDQNKNFALSCEQILNENDTVQSVKTIETQPSHLGEQTSSEDTNSIFSTTKKLVRRSSKIYKNFFRIRNNSEIFKLGKSFLDDYTEGKRCFGFSANGNKKMMVNTLYGIGSFFNFYCHTRALIFCSDDELIGLKKLVDLDQKVVYDELLEGDYELWESEGITVIPYSVFAEKSLDKAYDFIDKLAKLSGIVFCTTPENKKILNEIELYFQVFQRVDNFSCIIAKEKTKLREIYKTLAFLKNYKVSVKGVIVGTN
jgi:hypothetical protein